MKNKFIFLGPPGCGKGTQTSRLSKETGLCHIDTGSSLRAEIKNGTQAGLEAKSYMDKGQLVPLEVVAKIISNRLNSPECAKGFILDGFPRSLEQAKVLEEILGDTELCVIYFEVDKNELVERIVNRRSCSGCGEIYNLKTNPPKEENTCGRCGGVLIQRKDDNEQTAKLRFETYENETAPLVEFYEQKGWLKRLWAMGDIEKVYCDLKKIVEA